MKEEKLCYFEFSGTWTWGCYAPNLEAVKAMLSNEGYDELDISDLVVVDKYCDAGKIETYTLD